MNRLLVCFILLLNPCLLLPLSAGQLQNQKITEQKTADLLVCLNTAYRLSSESCEMILRLLKPLLLDPYQHRLIDEFIAKSHGLQIDFMPKENDVLPGPYDPVTYTPSTHQVIGENEGVRVLLLVYNPGERVYGHLHCWRSITLELQTSAVADISRDDGNVRINEDPPSVYELPPDERRQSYLNMGKTAYIALKFEIKR